MRPKDVVVLAAEHLDHRPEGRGIGELAQLVDAGGANRLDALRAEVLVADLAKLLLVAPAAGLVETLGGGPLVMGVDDVRDLALGRKGGEGRHGLVVGAGSVLGRPRRRGGDEQAERHPQRCDRAVSRHAVSSPGPFRVLGSSV
jgi:hypothetical protein